MRIRVDHYRHDLGGGVIAKLDAILAIGNSLPNLIIQGTETLSRISDEIQELAAQAAQATSGITAVKGLVEGLLQQIEDNAGDEAALQEIVATGRANLDALAAVGQPGTQPPPVIEEPPPVVEPPAEPPVGEDTQTA